MTKTQIYDDLSRLLTDYENMEQNNPDESKHIDWKGQFYFMLVLIQNCWEDVITVEE